MNRDELFLTSRKKTVNRKGRGGGDGSAKGCDEMVRTRSERGVLAGTATRVAQPHPEEGRVPAEASPVSACSFYILYEASAASASPWVTFERDARRGCSSYREATGESLEST